MSRPLRLVMVSVYIVVLVICTSLFVGQLAARGWLVHGAFILPVIPIFGLHSLKPRERFAGWAVFTVWLGSTYAPGGDAAELLVFGMIVVVALLAFFKYAWLMPAAWFFHIVWDFVPRELPQMLLQLPLACMIFDGMIGLYLVWLIQRGGARQSSAETHL